MRRIVLTGASGVIGKVLAKNLPREGEVWRLSDIRPLEAQASEKTEAVIGDLTDFDFAMDLCRDADTIIHMAGQPKEGTWDWLFSPNVVCSTNLWEAASQQGVKQVIYGSSNHVYGMYPTSMVLNGNEPLRPDSRYGVTKMFGEGLASLYADKYDLKVFVIRIGSFQKKPRSMRELYSWISPRDMCALVRLGLDADYRHETVFGISGNSRSWYNNARAFELGYRPVDNAEDHIGDIVDLVADPASPEDMLQGGGSSGREFRGDLSRLLHSKIAREQ